MGKFLEHLMYAAFSVANLMFVVRSIVLISEGDHTMYRYFAISLNLVAFVLCLLRTVRVEIEIDEAVN
jgi:hypothetical protein